MRELFQDTTFGRVARFVSRGKILGWEEYHDSALLDRYLNSKQKVRPVNKEDDVSEEVEKGTDFQLIDWIENDSKVCPNIISLLAGRTR